MMARKLYVARTLLLLSIVVAVTGCTSGRLPVDVQPAPETVAATTPPPVIAVTPTGVPTPSLCVPDRDSTKPQISGEYQQIPVDSGPRNGATGKVLVNQRGVPAAYLVASDDIPDFIAERFCVDLAYLNNINGVRRGGAIDLFAGDTLNLDAETLTTVGDINGEVKNYPSLPDPLPPQHEPDFL